MKSQNYKATIKIDVKGITCPNCKLTFIVSYIDMCSSNLLIDQVPDSGTPFYCPYCGIDVNKGG